MLDLQARVDLHEVEPGRLSVFVRFDDELHGAGVDVVDRARGGDGGRAHFEAPFGRQHGRGRFLEHLLVAALRGAFALVEVDHVAVRVAEDLDFDMARVVHVALEQHAVAAEGIARLALAGLEVGHELVEHAHDAHALAAAAVRGLDHQREADPGRFARQHIGRLVRAGIAGHDGARRLACIRSFAPALLPILRIDAACGPMKAGRRLRRRRRSRRSR
jgi:hypothetical protein